MNWIEILIWIGVALPPAIVGVLSYYWIKTRSKPAALYWNGEFLKHIPIDIKENGTFMIKEEAHTIHNATPVLFKARILGVKQFTYFVHYKKIEAMSLADFLEENNTKFLSDISPDAQKILLEGADIKATHQSLESMKFNFKNPMLLAGLGVGLALGIILVLLFYHPNIPVQVVSVAEKAPESVGIAKTAGFLVM